ncbi:pleckstrin homology-like domain family B member 3 isoform X2 [Microcaecilia unicolor]|uniref:Pleckstrin homology-like domain family B member 3 isoform X2 n=1 Tax=Microcaecilia unicolor TaxID=1415580 RepID=A0A6P7YVQ0_9AMPH|nr:pleckstrin homology-like domain family B member 3 isoform X2 [Microcaecilia unicolor]
MVVQTPGTILGTSELSAYLALAEKNHCGTVEQMTLETSQNTEVEIEGHCEEQEADSVSSEACSSPGGTTDSAEEDEGSSTESAHNGEENPVPKKQEKADVNQMQAEQLEVMTRISKLEQRVKELHQQKKELNIEMEMEGALLEGELRMEEQELTREEDVIQMLQSRLEDTEKKYFAEREKERANVVEERRKVDELERRYVEYQKLMDKQPESLRELLKKQIQEMSELLEVATKAFEDLEFQQLEEESSLEEERETSYRQITQEISEYQNNLNKRKLKVLRLEEQVKKIREQMGIECQALSEEKSQTMKSLLLEKNRLLELSDRCEKENRGSFPGGQQVLTKLAVSQKYLPFDNSAGSTHSCVLSVSNVSVLSSLKSSPGLQRTNSLPRRRGETTCGRDSDRPVSLHGNAGLLALQLVQLEGVQGSGQLAGSSSLQMTRLQTPLLQLQNRHLLNGSVMKTSLGSSRLQYGPENPLSKIAEMEKLLREALAEKERLLKAREAKRAAQEEARKKKEETAQEQKTQGKMPEVVLGPIQASQPDSLTVQVKNSRPAFNLRSHMESLGHSVETCPQVTVTAALCKGYLVKMGGRIKTWKKRWFVFDCQKRRLAYFADKEELKLKGVIYFQAIEEVYYDHLRSASMSPHPKLTFCVKTYERLFCMVAPTPEAMRLWIDVIVTAAEENICGLRLEGWPDLFQGRHLQCAC